MTTTLGDTFERAAARLWRLRGDAETFRRQAAAELRHQYMLGRSDGRHSIWLESRGSTLGRPRHAGRRAWVGGARMRRGDPRNLAASETTRLAAYFDHAAHLAAVAGDDEGAGIYGTLAASLRHAAARLLTTERPLPRLSRVVS